MEDLKMKLQGVMDSLTEIMDSIAGEEEVEEVPEEEVVVEDTSSEEDPELSLPMEKLSMREYRKRREMGK
jgi:mRNA degradation ribonuclease J1/J2